MNYPALKKRHAKLFALLQKEQQRQSETLNLIASENIVSEAVLEALGTVFTNKYAEGKSAARYYHGNQYFDEIEEYAKKLLKKAFRLPTAKWRVNVQPYSGSPANLAVYMALLQPGDTVLAMRLDHGGHLTHGHAVSATGKLWNFVHYGVTPEGLIDYEQVEQLVQKHKPKLVVCGASAYSRRIDFKKFTEIAHRHGALVMADISHIAGLVVGRAHPSPFPEIDVVTSTSHKTLRGSRGAFIIAREELGDALDRAVFPGLQGGPHGNQIFALAVALEEALKPTFRTYAQQIVKNMRRLAGQLTAYGFRSIAGGSDNHLCVVDVTSVGMTGKRAGELLEKAGIIVNKNMIPFDTRTPRDPSGIRIGTAAITTRGMKEKDMDMIADCIQRVLLKKESPQRVRKDVQKFLKKF